MSSLRIIIKQKPDVNRSTILATCPFCFLVDNRACQLVEEPVICLLCRKTGLFTLLGWPSPLVAKTATQRHDFQVFEATFHYSLIISRGLFRIQTQCNLPFGACYLTNLNANNRAIVDKL